MNFTATRVLAVLPPLSTVTRCSTDDTIPAGHFLATGTDPSGAVTTWLIGGTPGEPGSVLGQVLSRSHP